VRTLSRGLLQRCALARVFVHRPDLLFFDEPFTGLDADSQASLIASLGDAHRAGATLLMSTHDLATACAVCTSAAIIVGGRLAWHGPIAPGGRAELESLYHSVTHASPLPTADTRHPSPVT
jgi:ABC-type multidrug transport system ATPase subunit